MNIEGNIRRFMEGDNDKDKGRKPLERYASFDYCFNYFQWFKEENRIKELSSDKNIEQSCLQLAFYLASWGMYRGSGFILSKSVKFYEDLIKEISEFDSDIWDIDVDTYLKPGNI